MSLTTKTASAPLFEVLTEEGVQKLHEGLMDVMWRVGVEFPHAQAKALFAEAGATVDGDRIRMPESVIREKLALAPSTFTMYTRGLEPAMLIGGEECHFGTYGTAPYSFDPYTGERTLATRKTIVDAARICDYLPHIEWAMPMGVPSDVSVGSADRHQFYHAVVNFSKTLYSSTYSAKALEDVIEMASWIAGDMDALREKPFFTTGINPSSPLRYGADVIAKLIVMAEAGLPIVYNSCPLTCGTAPGTMAATVIMCLAESLAGAILAQIINPGVPVIPGGGPAPMDMRTTVCSHGSPEMGLMVAAHAQMMRFYGVPSYGTAGASNSKCTDSQAAIEAMNSIIVSALARSNMVHCVASIDTCMTVGLEAFVLCDEIIAMTRRIAGGMVVDDETLAVDVIEKIGPGGHFLEEDHTLRHFRKHHQSKLIDRQNYDGWIMSGGKTMEARLKDKVHWILENHEPEPLPDKILERLDRRMAQF